MFHPAGMPLERGWVGRIEGDEVVHLASQTLQHLFTGGGTARDHARYPLAGVELLVPLPSPPSIRVFDASGSFEFANPAAVVGPDARAVPVQLRVVSGNPGAVLVDEAADADLLVVGHRGRGGIASACLGSVGLHCVLHATCPVVVVRDARVPAEQAATAGAARA